MHNNPHQISLSLFFPIVCICIASICYNQVTHAGTSPPLIFNTIFCTTKISTNPAVQVFIKNMVTKHQFNANELTTLLDSTTLLPNIITKIQHPYEEQPWHIYKQRLVNQKRINYGIQYWQKHQAALQYAEKKYRVPAAIIVAIIGVESMYGYTPLKHPVLNSLVTLGFAYLPRANFFQSELEQYLLLTRELKINPKAIFGSYAGAIGLPQFMPSSYRKFAVAYCEAEPRSTKPKREGYKLGDLTNDTDDVVVSVANYLASFGWQENQPITIPAKVTGSKYQTIINETTTNANKLKPQHTIAYLKRYSIQPLHNRLPFHTKAILIELQNEHSNEYWLGLHNFYVLSRYNSNRQYVMAVYQLAEELKKAKEGSI